MIGKIYLAELSVTIVKRCKSGVNYKSYFNQKVNAWKFDTYTFQILPLELVTITLKGRECFGRFSKSSAKKN